MHIEALTWGMQHATADHVSVLDIGGRDVNGSPRALFPNAAWTCLDILPGPGVDIVADAATWIPDREYDIVVSFECFEHAKAWPQICETAFKACKPGGTFIATMAGPGRAPHSGIDGGPDLHGGEHYANVQPAKLRRVLEEIGWRDVIVDQQVSPFPCDTRCVAVR